MKLLLFNSPNPHRKFNENLAFVDEEFGIFTPLDLCYVSAIAKEHGHQTKIIDQKVEKLTPPQLKKAIDKFQPDILGLNIHSLYTFFEVLELAKVLKTISELPIVIGGYALRTHWREIMSYREFDLAIIGSALKTLPELLEALENKKEINKINGLAYRTSGKLLFTEPEVLAAKADELPIPDRNGLRMNKYRSIISKYKNFSIMLTSFGCPSKCTYCAINYFPYSRRTVEQVIAEIEECVYKYKVREIDFFDAYFTADKKFVTAICSEILKRKIKVTWSCRTSLPGVNTELLKLMNKAGCRKIYYGIESANQATLKKVKKELHLETVRKKLLETRAARIQTLGFFMIGLPGETEKEIRETIKFAKSLPLDWAQFSIMIAKPNTSTEKDLQKDKKFWSDYILGKVQERRIETPWCDLPYEQIKALTAEAYKQFYFRPGKILNFLSRIRSWDEFYRYAKAGIRALLS